MGEAAQAVAEVHKTQPLAAHGEIGNGRKDENRGSDRTSTKHRGETQAYLLRRLARDAPEVMERVKTGEFANAGSTFEPKLEIRGERCLPTSPPTP